MNTPDRSNRGLLGTFSSCWKPTLAVSFAALSIVICLLATVLCIVDLMHARSVAVGVARREAENLSQSLAQQTADAFEAADGALQAVVTRVEHDGSGPASRARLRDTIAALIATVPRIHNLSVADEQGFLVVSNSVARNGARLVSIADRPYFRYHRDHPGLAVHISGPAISKIDSSWVLFATRRINHADGSFAGVAIAPISLRFFERGFAEVDIGRSGTISLVSDDGTLIARRPRAGIGQRFADAAMFGDRYSSVMAASYVASSPIDGVRRLFAFERLANYPLVLQVGIAESEYLGAWRADAIANYAALAFGTALIGALASGLGAQITRRKHAEAALALSSTDALTGLANRRRFEAELEREWARAARDRMAIGMLMIEVANLKAFNDRYGHQEGDNLLISIARTIFANIISPSDIAARYDGLEFAVMLPAADDAGVALVAERIRAAIQGLVVQRTGTTGSMLPICIGIASTVPLGTDESASLVNAAFRALHDAKRDSYGDAPALAPVDALTGLADRRRFDTELEREWRRAIIEKTPVGLLMIGIDNLKAYNEEYGRQEGDELLVAIARTVANTAPPNTLAARYSGLGFAVLLTGTDDAGAHAVVDGLRLAILDRVARHTGTPNARVIVTCASASLVPAAADEPSKLVSAALIALHTSKSVAAPVATKGPPRA